MQAEKSKNILCIECFLVFTLCCVVYLANKRLIGTGDSIPNSLLALNWLRNHTLYFDAFRDNYFFENYSGLPYFFAESKTKHLVSVYPIGTAVVSLPIYFIFSIYLDVIDFIKTNITGIPFEFDLTGASFEPYRQAFEKLAATLATSLSVVIFYISSRLKFPLATSLISTFIYAFATNTWMTSSQALWQHTATNLVLTSLILCLLKANRAENTHLRLLLFIAGFLCGLLPIIRPTNLLFSIAAILYVTSIYRKVALFLLLGLPVSLLGMAWNFYNFGSFLGGYTALSSAYKVTFYRFNFNQFLQGFLGLMFSPSRGIFVFSPIVIFCIPGFWQAFKKSKIHQDERLITSLAIAAIALFLSYCFYTIWWAGGSYGPRFISDATPIICYLIGYFINSQFNFALKNQKIFISSLAIFLIFLAVSTYSQVLGAFSKAEWNGIPINVDTQHVRLWDFRDTQLSRHANSLFFQIVKPIENLVKYSQALAGSIEKVERVDMQRPNNFSPIPDIVLPNEPLVLRAKLRNTGKSRWLGYESGVMPGEVRVRLRAFNESNVQVIDTRLFVSGLARHNDVTEAIGSLKFPVEPGLYRLVFDLIAEGVGEFPNNSRNRPYEVVVIVQPKLAKNFQQSFLQDIDLVNNTSYLKLNTKLNLPVRIKNISNFPWSSYSSSPVFLSYHWMDKNKNVIARDGLRTPLPLVMLPNRETTINALIETPKLPGQYTLRLTMVQEGVAWFDERGAKSEDVPITVVSE
ncbi:MULTISPECIES: hypothetical protein [Trichocoleus]|uniref:Glycosyltransferase RgtA/B/C/D-like domain-containing protein n=1 Tax=Trichocoleus desertorum GB2-A4 TaxID=2933944 RepID=A0ABV0J7R7_9CYAN|nr:hypothetical protein [Trichocoleus sp. FACHB-46]MBD1862172.1 hypothetical protein [Trichocoleus sp. FACHB-46]